MDERKELKELSAAWVSELEAWDVSGLAIVHGHGDAYAVLHTVWTPYEAGRLLIMLADELAAAFGKTSGSRSEFERGLAAGKAAASGAYERTGA